MIMPSKETIPKLLPTMLSILFDKNTRAYFF